VNNLANSGEEATPMRKLLSAIILLGAVVLPAPAAQAAEPRFQVRCDHSHLAQEDPIVAPGERSEHMHEFFGNTTTNKDSTYESMIDQRTTCSTKADTAGYWVPTLISPGGQVIRAESLLIYYRGEQGERTEAFPRDMRMVSDDVIRDSSDEYNVIVKFPECWDGARTDSPDHISHMANASGEGCPPSHPVRVPSVTFVLRYPVQISPEYTLSSGRLRSMHADYWNTWDQWNSRT
jgi:hypothetical protein